MAHWLRLARMPAVDQAIYNFKIKSIHLKVTLASTKISNQQQDMAQLRVLVTLTAATIHCRMLKATGAYRCLSSLRRE